MESLPGPARVEMPAGHGSMHLHMARPCVFVQQGGEGVHSPLHVCVSVRIHMLLWGESGCLSDTAHCCGVWRVHGFV